MCQIPIANNIGIWSNCHMLKLLDGSGGPDPTLIITASLWGLIFYITRDKLMEVGSQAGIFNPPTRVKRPFFTKDSERSSIKKKQNKQGTRQNQGERPFKEQKV